MIKWTNERIAGAREEARDLGIFALEYAKPTDTFGVTMVLALAEIGLRVVDPSPEDVERVAAVMFELDPAYRDSAGEQRIRFEDVRISNGDYWVRRARAALAAIAEEDDR